MKTGLATAAFLRIALGGSAMAFELQSTAWEPGGAIPMGHSMEGHVLGHAELMGRYQRR